MIEDKQELARLLQEKKDRLKYNKILTVFPDEGEYRRELYPKHVAFMNAGNYFLQRAVIAANRTGKTMMGAYEMACHLTGIYPTWWEGKRFDEPISAWAASVNNEATKTIMQFELLGSIDDLGSGMIPRHILDKGRIVKKSGVADAIETAYIPHASGGMSRIDFKSYEQGRSTFQGTKKQVIWLDEEPTDRNIFTECLTRTMDKENPGIIYCTFTPLYCLSPIVLSFLPDGKFPPNCVDSRTPYRYVTNISWDEVPHLDERQKAELMASYSELERDARTKGLPSMGSGSVFLCLESDFVVDPFDIPSHWPRVYAMEICWDTVGVVWGAIDPASRKIYLYSEELFNKVNIPNQSSAVRRRGKNLSGVTFLTSNKRSAADGLNLLSLYYDEGLLLGTCESNLESGIYDINQLLQTGQFKVFSNLSKWLTQYRLYRRDERGRIVEQDTELMDATRYLATAGIYYARSNDEEGSRPQESRTYGQSKITGY